MAERDLLSITAETLQIEFTHILVSTSDTLLIEFTNILHLRTYKLPITNTYMAAFA